MTTQAVSRDVLEAACAAVGLDGSGAVPVRLAENEIWRLPSGVIVRIARSGQAEAAQREVQVAAWLAQHEIPAVRLHDVPQPQSVHGRPVTFWAELPPHEPGSPLNIAALLKRLHSLPPPDFDIGTLDPFVRIAERIDAASTLSEDDKVWLRHRRAALLEQWRHRPAGMAASVVHGDAWAGNVVRTATGPVMLDLERFSIGPPEWDLVSTAVKLTTTGAVTAAEYAEFCHAYGTDVTAWAGYELLASIRELRMATYAAQHAATRPEWRDQAQHRVDCLRGRLGPRPWHWRGIA
jgi:aminoglycoside phosphotransferase (APT) family kinase protein